MNRAFTLAELLGVIVVIGLLLLIIIPLIINGVSSREDDVENLQNNIIFDATDEFLDNDPNKYPDIEGNIYCVSIGELLEAGKLVDPVKKLVEEGNYSNLATVKVTIRKNGVRDYVLVEADQCKAQNSEDIAITVSPANNVWSREKTVTVVYPSLEDHNTNSYTRDNGTNWVNVSRNDIELTYQQDGNISAKVVDSSGKTLVDESEKIERIDRDKPSVVNINKGPWDNLQQQIDITLTDAKSGVAGYYISTSNNKPEENNSKWVKYELSPYGGIGTISLNMPNGTYYLYVKDRAGNISEAQSFTISDDSPPTCEITVSGVEGNNDWYRSTAEIKLITDDPESGIARYGLSTSESINYNSKDTATQQEDTKGTTYYGYVEDKAGNSTKCQVTVKKDTVGPSISSSNSSNSRWTNQNVIISGGLADESSGVNNIVYRYSEGGTSYSDWSSLSSSAFAGIWSAERDNDVYLVATDNAGNETIAHAGKVRIDKTPPSFNYRIQYVTSNDPNGYRSRFGWNVTDNLSGFDNTSSLFEYCYDGHNSSSCGATCWQGNQYSHRPSYINPSDNAYFNDAHFEWTFYGALNYDLWSGAVTSCVTGHTIYAYFRICDIAGNCASHGSDAYAF